WAYYNGAVPNDQSIGIAANFREIDPAIDDAIFNGMLGIRCWRGLYPADGDPTFGDLPAEGQEMFYEAHEQLDNAMWHAWARQLREYIEQQPTVCDSAADANWAFLQVAGPILDPEAAARDGATGATLAALWANDAPSIAELQEGVTILDTLFPCPQCESCPVPQEWGY
ncbi:MAG: hypothetical protein IAG13_22650, partial [Deltaproteobacteria bacterium]|nr:hypothetical protein [Nannocystaceae bacterium]